jgi:hypothetical protein
MLKAIKVLGLVLIAFVLLALLFRPVIRDEIIKNHWIKFPSVIPTSEWKKFSSDEGKFSVWFPGIPDLTNDVVTVSNIDLPLPCYFIWNRQNEYAVNYTDLPKNLEKLKPEQLLDISQKAVGIEVGKIVYQKNIEFANYPGREFEYVVDGKVKYSGRVRLILVADRLYQMIVIFLTANPHTADRETFFNSFSVQKN